MREINLDLATTQNAKAPRLTFLLYGPTGSGKTTLAGSFPRPLFLSDVTESGYESLRGLDPSLLFEPDVQPIVWGIEKMTDMATAREQAARLIASGMIQTVVVDSLTFYADLYLNSLFDVQGANRDNRKAYGDLGIHLRDCRVKWHAFPCNVVWLCLAQDPDDDRPNGGPMIPGREAGKFGAGCDYQMFLRHDRFKQGGEMVDVFETHTKNYGKYVARVRRAQGVPELPSPMFGATYSSILTAMGYDPEDTRKALPAYQRPAPLVITPTQAPPAAKAAPVAEVRHNPAPNAQVRHVPTAARPAAGNGARPSTPAVTRRPAAPVGQRGNS